MYPCSSSSKGSRPFLQSFFWEDKIFGCISWVSNYATIQKKSPIFGRWLKTKNKRKKREKTPPTPQYRLQNKIKQKQTTTSLSVIGEIRIMSPAPRISKPVAQFPAPTEAIRDRQPPQRRYSRARIVKIPNEIRHLIQLAAPSLSLGLHARAFTAAADFHVGSKRRPAAARVHDARRTTIVGGLGVEIQPAVQSGSFPGHGDSLSSDYLEKVRGQTCRVHGRQRRHLRYRLGDAREAGMLDIGMIVANSKNGGGEKEEKNLREFLRLCHPVRWDDRCGDRQSRGGQSIRGHNRGHLRQSPVDGLGRLGGNDGEGWWPGYGPMPVHCHRPEIRAYHLGRNRRPFVKLHGLPQGSTLQRNVECVYNCRILVDAPGHLQITTLR